jgi:hypothetical protein
LPIRDRSAPERTRDVFIHKRKGIALPLKKRGQLNPLRGKKHPDLICQIQDTV